MTPPVPALADRNRPKNVVVKKSRAELLEWRRRLIKSTNMDEADLRELAENWELRGPERDTWETIRRIDWLLKRDNR
ncbi:hypothetical protein GCM10029992_12270 [Glycomyces albus]